MLHPEKFPRTNTQPELSIQARRKAAEERVANLVHTINAAASPPETMTTADISRPPSKKPLRTFAYALWYHTNGTDSVLPPSTGAARADMVARDANYQASRAFTLFRRPNDEHPFIYCIHCV